MSKKCSLVVISEKKVIICCEAKMHLHVGGSDLLITDGFEKEDLELL